MKGLVVKSTGSWYIVVADDGREFRCRVKGKLRLLGLETTNPLSVGDVVIFEQSAPDEGIISEMQERRNYIVRKSVNLSKQAHVIASNLDLALVVATPVFPRTSTGFIDRFLATAEAYNIPGGIVFNKKDLFDDEVKSRVDGWCAIYREIGYRTYTVSAFDESSLAELQSDLKGKVTLFSGHSGTGKSTLINALIPGKSLKTGAISEQHLKGKHTTTFAEMHRLPEGGYIVDTPGIREFGILDFDKFQVGHYFPEIFKMSADCKFNNCLHVNEKDCAVLKAVESSRIALSRYASYISILNNEDIFK